MRVPDQTRPWSCPQCGEVITLTLTYETKDPTSEIVTMIIDDLDVRVHIAWHDLCTCQWSHEHLPDGSVHGERTKADPACEMHP